MRVEALLSELASAGVIITATSDGDLELDAPRGMLTTATLTALRQYKAKLVGLLSRRCPFCRQNGMRIEETWKDNLHYFDTFCVTCGELTEVYIPANADVSCGQVA